MRSRASGAALRRWSPWCWSRQSPSRAPRCAPASPLATFDVYNALQGFAQLGLLALALGLTMIAGEFDLSVVGTYALGGMLAVQTGRVSRRCSACSRRSAAAPLIGAVQGGLIAGLRIPSMPVTLATYIALLGLTYALSGGLSVSLPQLRRHPLGRPDGRRRLLAAKPDHARRVPASPPSCWAAPGSAASCVRSAATGAPAGSPASASSRPWSGSSPSPACWRPSAARCSATASRPRTPTPGCSRSSSRPWPRCWAASRSRADAVRALGLLAGALSVALLAQVVAMVALPDYTTQLFYAALLGVIVALESPGLRRAVDRLRPSPGAHPSRGKRDGQGLMANLTFDFTGRTVLVTGAARGVGRAIAAQFRNAGATVYLVDVEADAVAAHRPGDRRDRAGRRRL